MGIISLITQGKLIRESAIPASPDVPMQRDIYAPNFEILIHPSMGKSPFLLSDNVTNFITEVEYEDNANQFDRLSITLESQIDTGDQKEVLSIIDSKVFSEGQILEVRMGYGNALFTVGAAFITKISPDFPSGGAPSLLVEGHDPLYRASRSRPRGGMSYLNSKFSDVIREIGARNGFIVEAQDPRSFENITVTKKVVTSAQSKGMSDYEFMRKVADINGFDLFARFDPTFKKFVLFFQPPAFDKQKEVFTFVYNEGDVPYSDTLMSFSPTLDAFEQATDFEAFFVKDRAIGGSSIKFSTRLDAQTQSELRDSQERRIGGHANSPKQAARDGIEVAFKAFGQNFRFPPHQRFQSEADVAQAIQEFIKRQKENFITGRAVVLGKEVLQSRQVHNFEGVSKEFSGKYIFDSVVHRMSRDSGYEVEISCHKVIEDVVVQPAPELVLTELNKRIQKFKGFITGTDNSSLTGGSGGS